MNADVQDLSEHYDRISSMPDSILIHILTFLTAREAVQTCLLSKRWIDLWAYLPSLEFNSEEFENGMIFKRFVNAFLLFRKTSQLDTFQLAWLSKDKDVDTRCVTTWVVYAVRCKPRVLTLGAWRYDCGDLPHSIFCCTPLEELNLFMDNWKFHDHFIAPRSINLPFLKKLCLVAVHLEIDKLLLGCPLLENLELQGCNTDGMKISSSSLKYLTIIECYPGIVIISCPNMINLYLNLDVCDITLRNLFSLRIATIWIDDVDDLEDLYCCEILNGLSHATELKLFGRVFKTILAKELPNCSTFKNLRHLVLDVCLESGSLDIMACFLQCSPNLDIYYFSYFKEHKIADDYCYTDNEDEDVYSDDD